MRAYALGTALSVGLGLLVGIVGCEPSSSGLERGDGTEVPRFEVEADWPRTLPNNWILGQVAGLAVDGQDHVWIAQRPGSLSRHEAAAGQDPPLARCCVPAPEIIEFAPDGRVVQAWNGPERPNAAPDYAGGSFPHGIYVDPAGHVWVGGGLHRHHVLKFSQSGELLLEIGEADRTGGSNHTELLGGPADVAVDPEADEVFIADGYVNRRVVVFSATTGEYRRHWGAYGERPHDDPLGSDRVTGKHDEHRQFRGPVHGIVLSDDGRLYVTDRENNRIQVFRKDGTFVEEVFVRPETRSTGSVWDMDPTEEGFMEAIPDLIPGSTWDVALSDDPEQRWLYVADGTNNVVWILERATLEVEGHFGHGGTNAGQFGWVHNLDVDSDGNIFTSEVNKNKRVQRFRRVR